MAIDIAGRKPVFDNITAGLSGPAIRPIALNLVWELVDKVRDSKKPIPVIGIGGITCTDDALEYLMAGASAVQVGSATFANPHTMIEIIDGVQKYMSANKIQSVGDISIRNKW
jgi:dihydroorotate dehydrogenase (NAD+) catalytic subunit